MKLLIPTYSTSYGVTSKTYPAVKDGVLFYGALRTFGGTERDINGVYSVENTGVIDTWFRPDIKSECRIVILQTGAVYDIVGTPENIKMQNQYLRFRVSEVTGGA